MKKRKYIVLLGDGMADEALEELDGRTPLEAAHTPHMDGLTRRARMGLVRTIPVGFPAGSDIGNLTILGYDPKAHYTGRAPIEAASLGVELGPHDVAFRCNLVKLSRRRGKVVMADYSAGHIKTDHAHRLLARVQAALGTEEFRFYPGVSYRHLLVWTNGKAELELTPPHDIPGQPIAPFLPQGDGAETLIELMCRSQEILKGEQANSIWLWGGGTRPQMPAFRDRFGVEGAVISAVDLIKGLGVLAGLEVLEVPGATGYLDTNYAGKVTAALDALGWVDMVYLHVEAPDEAGHEGNLQKKLQAIEAFDERIVGPVLEGLEAFDDYAVLLITDHYTPIRVRTHVGRPVPYAIYRHTPASSDAPHPDPEKLGQRFTERSAQAAGTPLEEGHRLMGGFLEREPHG